MEAIKYLIIQENVVSNIVMWTGNTNEWTPPNGSIVLIYSETPVKDWVADAELKTFVLREKIGGGDIGFTWNGEYLMTNDPKPEWKDSHNVKPNIPTTEI